MIKDTRIKVRRDGPRGWHYIAAENFNPSRHERYVDVPSVPLAPAPPLAPPPAAPVLNIPPDWRKSSAAEVKALAERISGRTPDNREQAVAVIEAALIPPPPV